MTYAKQTWVDLPVGGTPLSAARLNHVEDGLEVTARGDVVRTAVKTAAYTAAAGDLVPVDASAANVTVTLPTAPVNGTRVAVKAIAVGAGKSVTVQRGGTSDVFNKTAGVTSVALTLVNQAITVQYDAGIWTVVSDDVPKSALDGTYAPKQPVPNTVVLLGDSITANCGPSTSGTDFSYSSKGWWWWAMQDLRHPLRLITNAGVTGETSAQILARFDTAVTANAPGWVVILAGRNDGTIGAAATIANLAAMYDKALVAGIKVIACTLPPGNGLAGAQRTADNQINQWIKRQGRYRPNLYVVDWSAALQDTNGNFNTSGVATTAVSQDGIHPITLGARRMGKILADTLRNVIPPVDTLASNNDDAASLVSNPLLFGTAGTVAGGGTGVCADGWFTNVFGTGVTYTASKIASTDGYPNLDWQEINVTAQTGLNAGQFGKNLGVIPQAGDGNLYYAECEFWLPDAIPAGSNNGAYLQLSATGGASNVTATDLRIEGDTPGAIPQLYPRENQLTTGVWRTPPIAIPAGSTNVQPAVFCNFVGRLRVRRFDLRKYLDPTAVS